MTKAEIEDHWRQYGALLKKARQAEDRGEFLSVVEFAEASWQYVDGMLRQAFKLDGRDERMLDAFTLVFRYAPILLDHQLLNRLEGFLVGKRRISKSSAADLGDGLAEARELMWRCHAVWNALEMQEVCSLGSLRRRFTGEDHEWELLIRSWKTMGIVLSNDDAGTLFFRLATQMSSEVIVKCSHCGTQARHPRPAIFEAIDCKRCERRGHFVFVSESLSQ